VRVVTAILIFFLATNKDFPQYHIAKLKISQLKTVSYVFTTYKTIAGSPFATNGMYLVTDKGVVLNDSPWDTTQFQPLLDSIAINYPKKVIICTSLWELG